MRVVYSLAIFLYGLAIRLTAIFNHKAELWVKGRQGIFIRLKTVLKNIDRNSTPVIWFHASSLGEFEQGRPVLEAFRENYPKYKILLTFFSPSGFEIRKTYPKADFIFYLPLDTPFNASRWVELVQPRMVIFIKYDFWYNFLRKLHQNKIPVYFISSVFRPGQHYFQWYGHWFRHQLDTVTWFFVQNNDSANLLRSIGKNNVSVAGDTRFDRVFSIALQRQPFPLVEKFCAEKKIFIGGSTWKEDEEIILPFILNPPPNMKFILAPHDTSRERIESLTNRLKRPYLLYSEMNEQSLAGQDVLIVDSIGILSRLYQYATVSFIGGGFGAGIHNIQEPVTFGVPVFFGPRYHKFKEASELVRLGGAFSVQTSQDLEKKVLEILSDPDKHKRISEICRHYVEENRGATPLIMDFIKTLPV